MLLLLLFWLFGLYPYVFGHEITSTAFNYTDNPTLVDKVKAHFLSNINKTGKIYYSRVGNVNGNNYNVNQMLDSVNTVEKTLFDILYGTQLIRVERDKSIYYQLGDEDIFDIMNILQGMGYEYTTCPDATHIHRVFYNYIISSLKATMEIVFNRQLSSDAEKVIREYFNEQRMTRLWQDYESKTHQEPIHDCDDSETSSKFPHTKYNIDIDNNIEIRDYCEDSAKPDLPDGRKVHGNGAFHFDTHYANANAGKDYYMAIAIGKNTYKHTGFYFAYYGVWGYTGYQPIGLDNKGRQKLRLIYSSFSNKASVVNNQNCNPGADGGPGVTCRIEYSAIEYNKLYYIRSVYNEKARVFTGYFIDPYAKKTIEIGSFKYSVHINWQQHSSNGFIEHYSARNKQKSCCQMDMSDVFFVCPFGKGVSCSKGHASEYGSNCKGKHSDLYSNKVDKVIIDLGSDRYTPEGLYIHRGWVPDA